MNQFEKPGSEVEIIRSCHPRPLLIVSLALYFWLTVIRVMSVVFFLKSESPFRVCNTILSVGLRLYIFERRTLFWDNILGFTLGKNKQIQPSWLESLLYIITNQISYWIFFSIKKSPSSSKKYFCPLIYHSPFFFRWWEVF